MKKVYVVIALLVVTSFLLTACGGPLADLGTEKNPIVWVFVPSGELERVSSGADAIIQLLHDETGLYFESFVATDYVAAIEAECSDPAKAHMGSLATFALIAAADRGCAFPELVAARRGALTYDAQIYVAADSGITTLAEIKGNTFCAPSATSTSGWIIPSIMLRAAGIDITDPAQLEIVYGDGAHESAVMGVYNGDCQAGSGYVDARTRVEADYPDVMEKLTVIEVSVPIPNDGVQFIADFPEDMRDQIVAALLKIAATDEGALAINEAYQWDALEEHDNTFYDEFRQLLDAAGINAADLQ
ncbi:phosphate/phosphite/phosphonate ABC transporter substrate-binding protein [Chloroflexota bacterium]